MFPGSAASVWSILVSQTSPSGLPAMLLSRSSRYSCIQVSVYSADALDDDQESSSYPTTPVIARGRGRAQVLTRSEGFSRPKNNVELASTERPCPEVIILHVYIDRHLWSQHSTLRNTSTRHPTLFVYLWTSAWCTKELMSMTYFGD
jgi:hypothetical protein